MGCLTGQPAACKASILCTKCYNIALAPGINILELKRVQHAKIKPLNPGIVKGLEVNLGRNNFLRMGRKAEEA